MNIAFLEEILRTNTPSGYEEELMTVMDKYLSPERMSRRTASLWPSAAAADRAERPVAGLR